MSGHHYEPVVGSPRIPSRRVPTSASNGYFTPVSTLSSRDSSGWVRGNYSAGAPTPKKESPPMPRFRRMETSPPITSHRVSSPSSLASVTPVFKRMDTLPPIIHQNSPPGKPQTRRRETNPLPVYIPNPPPTPPYSTPSQSSKRRSQLSSRSQSSNRSHSPVRIIQGDRLNLVRSPSPIEIAIPPPTLKEKPVYNPGHSYRESDASSIAPLPATVYVPGEGGEEDQLLPEREEDIYELHMQRPSHNSIYHTPPESMRDSVAEMSGFQVPPSPVLHHLDSTFLPRRALSYGEPTQADLIGLWSAAQGAKRIPGTQNEAGKTFVLNMYRQAPLEHPNPIQHSLFFPEHFTFGTTPNNPFYAIYAMRETPQDETFNELTLLRRDPAAGMDISVITLGLEPPSRRISPAGDGLITLIYPKEAVLSAMSPSTPLIRDGNTGELIMSPQSKTQEARAKEAIQKAYATECCRLSWNAQRRRYYLYHPGVADGGDAYLVEITGEVGFDHLGAKGSIKLINVDTNETMVELDFARSLLFVNTRATGKIPSDYIVDVAVCAVLTVATVEGRRMRIVRRSQSASSTMSGLGKWGDEDSIDERERGGCWGGLKSCIGRLFKKRRG
ncbi:hypothetical protein L873DRAFT_195931 [Choiromyces venosus 120613-1]|uniref:Uncharacterized protein n=1 Tax=Choiromyces venosus 120613-1 TaxID=1336337 RepID=A0A3N4J1Z0_9PEZI|nr:hypothetical protein L873DRAFT_195931 [Choiromyces venosus 120613-1]